MRGGEIWLGYDDEATVSKKAAAANYLGLGGVTAFSVDTDDFSGVHSQMGFPLLRVRRGRKFKWAPKGMQRENAG